MEVLNKNAKIKKIIHLADIHIRKNSDRDNEYREVFQKLYDSIEESEHNLIIIAGDTLDSIHLSNTAIVLMKELMINLAEKIPICIYRGNHESFKSEKKIDCLKPILYKLKTKNEIYILEKSGTYQYGNLIFSYTDVFDNQVNEIEGFDDKIKIGLFHGIVNTTKKIEGWPLSTGKFSVDDFKNVDYGFFGDVHLACQISDEKKDKQKCYYSGSLLQQSQGETLKNHGYYLHDLEKKTSRHIEIPNKYGFITLYVKNNKLQPIQDDIPENVYLRIIHENSEQETINDIYEDFKKKYNIITYVTMKKETQLDIFHEEEKDEEKKTTDDTIVDRLIDYIKKNNIKNLEDEEIDTLEEIIREKVKNLDYKYDTDAKHIKLKSMYFSNFTTYGESNYVDFSDMKGKIINLSGRNGIGKSSIIQALIYGLYGVKESKQISREDYINVSKLGMDIVINFEVNGVDYRIHRGNHFRGKKRDKANCVQTLIVYKDGKDISEKSLPEIHKQIEGLVGTYENFVNVAIMEQKYQKKFVDQDEKSRVEHILKVLKLDVYDLVANKVEEEVRGLKAKIRDDEENLFVIEKKTGKKKQIVGEIERLKEDEKEELEEKLANIEEEEKEENKALDKLNRKKIEMELKTKDLKKKEDVEEYQRQNKDLNKKKNKKEEDKNNKEDKINVLKKELEKLKKSMKNVDFDVIEKKHKEFIKNKEKKLKKINEEINLLVKELVKIEGYDKTDDELIEERDEKEEEYNEILDKIKILEEEIEKLKNEKIDEKKLNKKKKKYDVYKNKLEKTGKAILLVELNMKEKKKKLKGVKVENKENNDKYKENIKKMEKNIKKEWKDLDEKIKMVDELKEQIINVGEKYSDNLDKKYGEYQELKEQIEKMEEKLEKNGKLYDDYAEHMEMISNHEYNEKCEVCMRNKLTKDVIETKNKIVEYKKMVAKNKKELDGLNLKLEKLEKYNTQYKERDNDKNSNEEIKKNIELFEGEIMIDKQKMDNNKKSLEYEKKVMDEKKREMIILEEEIKNLEKELEELNEIKDELDNEYKDCLDYEKIVEMEKENKTKIVNNKKEIEIMKKTEEVNKLQIKQIDEQLVKLEKEREANLHNKKIEEKMDEKKEEYEKKSKEEDDEYEEYVNNMENKKNLEMEIMDLSMKVGELNNEIRDIMLQAEKNNEIVGDYNKSFDLLERLDEVRELYYEKNEKISNIIKSKGLIMKDLGRIELELKNMNEMKNKYKDKMKRLNLMEMLRDVIRGGFIDKVLSCNVIPKMCNEINEILSSFVDFEIDIEYDNKKIYIHKRDINGVLSNAIQLSGYESLIFECAYRLFINKSNKVQKFNCMCCDEIFSFMDESSINKVPNLFSFMRNLYDFVIIVSHDEKIQTYTDENLNVEYDGKFSSVCNNEDRKKILMNEMEFKYKEPTKKKTKDEKEYKKKNKVKL